MKRYLTLLVATAWACGSVPESFEPSERSTARSPDGHPAAEYRINGTRGEVGEVKVWSRGTSKSKGATVLHVGFDIDNPGTTSLILDPARIVLESAVANGVMLRQVSASRMAGDSTVGPDSNGTVEAYFTLPADVSPQEMDSFRVRWVLRDGDQLYSRATPFREIRETYAYYDDYPFTYDDWGEPFYRHDRY